jgi:hypothetical protein
VHRNRYKCNLNFVLDRCREHGFFAGVLILLCHLQRHLEAVHLALELDDRTSFRDIAGGISDAETWSDIVQKWCAVQEQEHELASEMENPEMFGRYQINENEMLRLMLHKLGSSETLRVLQRFLSFADRLSPEAYVPIIRVGRITQTRERYLWHKSSEQLNGCSMHVCVCVCVCVC